MRTKGRTPVIAGRVPQSLYLQIQRAAKRSGRTISDELAWRVALTFVWQSSVEIRDLADYRPESPDAD